MTPEESLALLTEASYIDPTLLPAHDEDRVAAALTWAKAIHPDTTYDAARERMFDHFHEHGTDKRLTPADINGATGTKIPMYMVPLAQRQDLPQLNRTTGKTEPCTICGNILRATPPFQVPEPSHNGNHPACLGDDTHNRDALGRPLPEPCDECGNHYIHSTELRSDGKTPMCSKAPGRVS